MHEHGVLHNDIAPQNVVRRFPEDEDGQDAGNKLCLIDFGESRMGTKKELAQEKRKLSRALNMPVEPLRSHAEILLELLALSRKES